MNKADFLWLALAPFLLLAACSGDDDFSADKVKLEKPEKRKIDKVKTENLICPQVAILQEAQVIHDYDGAKSDEAGAYVGLARMKSIEGDCGYRDDGVDIKFALHMNAVRGKKTGSGKFAFPYFIAIVDPADNVLSRQSMIAHFDLSGGDKNAQDDEQLHVFLPLTQETLPAGPDYRVLVGFKLPADQIEN